jgi:hypothetical protein
MDWKIINSLGNYLHVLMLEIIVQNTMEIPLKISPQGNFFLKFVFYKIVLTSNEKG